MRRFRAPALAAALCLAAGPANGAAQTLRIPFPQDDGTLTPYTFQTAYPLVMLIYDTLTWRDEQGVPRPWLARSVRRGRDPRKVVIRLRDGVRWHDGRPLTAEDVVFTFGFVADRYHPRFTPQLRDVASVAARDARTVVVTLRRPSLGFEDQPLSDVPILPAHRWRDVPDDRLAPAGPPVGSGPYRLVEHRRGRGYRLDANARYFLGAPRVQRIDVPIIRFPDATIEALNGRRVDALPVSLPPSYADSIRSLGVRIATGTSYAGTALLLNTRRAPFDRAEARRAVAQALDLTRITRSLSDIPGDPGAVPAERGYVHPQSRWAPGKRLHRLDAAAARVALIELGLPPIRVLAPRNDPVRAEAARQVVLALGRSGARATLLELPAAGLERAIGQDGSSPDFDAAVVGIPPLASYDPAFLEALFGDPAGSPLNHSGYRSARFAALARRAAAAATPAARRAAIEGGLRLLARDAPAIPLFFAIGRFAYRPAIYDAWTYVAGAGILDKRSLLPRGSRRAASRPPPAAADPIARRARADEDSGIPLWLAAVALAAVAAGAGGLAVLRGRR